MNITRRNFIKLITSSALTMIALEGCNHSKQSNDISLPDLKSYELITYETQDEVIDSLRSKVNSEPDNTINNAMLICHERHRTSLYSTHVYITIWTPENDYITATNGYTTDEQAMEEFLGRINVKERRDAYSVFIEVYGPKKVYTAEEIEALLKGFESVAEKSKEKTLR